MATHGARNTFLFRNGVDPARFVDATINKSHNNTKNNRLRIVYTGLLGYAQGIAGICRNINFKQLNAEFHIYGAGGEQKEIENYLALHNDKAIFYHGMVSRPQIPQILAQYDCTLIPLVKNIYGAVPSKIYESMAAGLPIFFSGEGEGANIITNYHLGWVSPALDYETLIANITNVVASPSLREEISNNCTRCANLYFNRPKQIEALYNHIKSLNN